MLQEKMCALAYVFLFVLSTTTNTVAFDKDDDDLAPSPSPLQKEVDVYQHFPEPVPFGHITLEGFGDPFSSAKQPLDWLELQMRAPTNEKEAEEMLKSGRSNIQFMKPEIPRGFSSPRDQYIKETLVQAPEDKNSTGLKWYDIVHLQTKNIMQNTAIHRLPKKDRGPIRPKTVRPQEPYYPKKDFFVKDRFELVNNRPELLPINWTTCDEFAVGAIFSPKDIVNIKWTPFYIWSTHEIASSIEHTFTYPTKKLVKEFYTKYKNHLHKTLDWTKTKLFMKGMNDMLLIAADKRGLFDAIPAHELPDAIKDTDVKVPLLSLRLKIEDPYLVMTFCEDQYAAVMAITGNQPTIYREMVAEAATIKFVGVGRPVWRDYEGERERVQLEQRAKLEEERDKIIILDEPIPPIGQYD